MLELMGIIDIPQLHPPRGETPQPARSRKRNSDELVNEEDDDEARDVKPGEEALLRAKLHDLQVSSPSYTLSRLADEIASGQGRRETSKAV